MTRLSAVMGIALLIATPEMVAACDMSYDPAYTWERAIDTADVVFIGTVTHASPETMEGFGNVEFEVETWIKGGSGPRFVSANGSGSNCVMEFSVGYGRLIFVGHWLSRGDSNVIAVADDHGPPYPVTYISDPPTPEQQAKLAYVHSISRSH